MAQLTRTLRDTFFAPVEKSTALFPPPVCWLFFTLWTLGIERAGRRLFPTLAGVNDVEATKQIYVAPTRATNIRRVKDYVLVPGAAAPA